MNKYTIKDYLDLLIDRNFAEGFDIEPSHMNDTVYDISFNTETQKKGGIFICKGAAFKREYLEKAIKNGAVLYISEVDYNVDIPGIFVNDIRLSMPYIASLFFDNPLASIKSIGITGTKGKTTTAYIIKSIIDNYTVVQGRQKCALISSIEVFDGKDTTQSIMTTPEAVEYQRIFASSRDNRCEYIVSEVSSQALKYSRCTGAYYDAAVFTNISTDHISPYEHHDYNDYYTSKLNIFTMCKRAFVYSGMSEFTKTFERAKEILQKDNEKRVYTYGTNENDDYKATDIVIGADKTRFKVNGNEYTLSMPGVYNVYNALAAISVTETLGVPYGNIKAGLENVKVPGRAEIFSSKDRKTAVIVDYAHNKESLSSLIDLAKEYYKDRKICLVFGCPGGKAYNRREEMGKIANRCDSVILTEDDPAKENVSDICAEIGKYITETQYKIIENRPSAIAYAIENHTDGYVILIAGKGSERTQKRQNGAEPYESDAFYVNEKINEYDKEISKTKVEL